MTNPVKSTAQGNIEARLEPFKDRPVDEAKTMEEVFGPVEDWTMEIGLYRLLLFPLTRRWWFYDPVHESWEDTGRNAGEVEFYLREDLLEAREPSRAAVPEAAVPSQEPRPAPSEPGASQAQAEPTLVGAAPAAWRLTVLTGPRANESFMLGEQTRIGRAPDNEIVLDDPQASRNHALFQRRADRCVLEDLGSSNGTSVNGRRLTDPVVLNPKDVIVIGDTELVIDIE